MAKITLREFFARECDELRTEHQDPTIVKKNGASVWSDPSLPVDVKHFFNHDGNLGIEDIDEAPGQGQAHGGTGDGFHTWLDQAHEEARDLGIEHRLGDLGSFERAAMNAFKMGGSDPGSWVKQYFSDRITRVHQDPVDEGWDEPTSRGRRGLRDTEIEEMGGPGSGSKGYKGMSDADREIARAARAERKVARQRGDVPVTKPVDTVSLPDELPDDWTADAPEVPSEPEQADDTSFAREPGDTGDELSWLDDPELGKDVEIPKHVPKDDPSLVGGGDSGKPEFPAPDEEEDFNFIGLHFQNPKAAEEIKAKMGRKESMNATFRVVGDTTFVKSRDGDMWWYTDADGWTPYMDQKGDE